MSYLKLRNCIYRQSFPSCPSQRRRRPLSVRPSVHTVVVVRRVRPVVAVDRPIVHPVVRHLSVRPVVRPVVIVYKLCLLVPSSVCRELHNVM